MPLDPCPFENIGLIKARKCELKMTWMQKQLGALSSQDVEEVQEAGAPPRPPTAPPWA